MPRVSVILPFYNRAACIERCVRSVLGQSFADFEIVAVDDASTDESACVITALGDPRIRVLRHETNRGPSGARNTALRAAAGEVFAFIDSDDEWLPGKLAAQLALLDGPPGCDLCGCEYFRVADAVERRVELPRDVKWAEWLHFRCELGSGTTLTVRRHVVDAVGLLDETFRVYEDWDWVLRMVLRFRYDVVHEPLARVHAGAPRPAEIVAASAAQFLRKHEAEFRRLGPAHWGRVRSEHFEAVAALAFSQRQFALGSRSLLKSWAAAPARNPLRLGALALAPVDALCGTSLLRRAIELQRRWRGEAG